MSSAGTIRFRCQVKTIFPCRGDDTAYLGVFFAECEQNWFYWGKSSVRPANDTLSASEHVSNSTARRRVDLGRPYRKDGSGIRELCRTAVRVSVYYRNPFDSRVGLPYTAQYSTVAARRIMRKPTSVLGGRRSDIAQLYRGYIPRKQCSHESQPLCHCRKLARVPGMTLEWLFNVLSWV